MFRRVIHVLRSLAGSGRPDDLCALIEATAEPSVWCRACGCWNGHAHPDCWGAEPVPEWAYDVRVRVAAACRMAEFGDEDQREWDRELMHREEA